MLTILGSGVEPPKSLNQTESEGQSKLKAKVKQFFMNLHNIKVKLIQ